MQTEIGAILLSNGSCYYETSKKVKEKKMFVCLFGWSGFMAYQTLSVI